jgi:hypothetical protein
MRKEANQMRKLSAGILGLLCLVAVAGCTTNKSIANITMPRSTLVMSVGTINDSAGTLGIGGTSLNVVTSFRNANGASAYENPGSFSLTGPGGSIVSASGGSTCPDPSFSTDELFSYGLGPTCVTDADGNFLWGMPPTYNPPDALGGYSLGFFPTDAAPTSGGYTLQTKVPVNGGNLTYNASATLPASPIVLPDATGVTGFVSDGLGGGTFTIGNPAKPRDKAKHVRPFGVSNPITEYLIIVISGGTVATVETSNTSATITGSGTACPGGPGAPIPCGPFSAYVIGADYPMVEAGPPANTSVSPSLAGPGGTSDITVSPVNSGLTE